MDHYQRSARNALRAFSLHREAERREDPAWLARQRRGARLVPVLDDGFPATPGGEAPLFLGADEAATAHRIPDDELVYLGRDAERAWFAWPAGRAAGARLASAHGATQTWDLRRAGLMLDPATAGLLAYAMALCRWHRDTRFCGRCGGPTSPRLGGHQRVCRDRACGRIQFPRVDPAVIVRIGHGDRVLLGRQPQWPPDRFSVVAGFVEPAESLEDAVRREVSEETGLVLARVDYHSSQPWPFPASLMLGFTAESAGTDAVAGDELESVIWLNRDELADRVRGGRIRLSPRLSIAYRLLEDWYDAAGGRLADLVDARGEPVGGDAR